MKLTIKDGEERIVRYGVQDFQVRDDVVEVFYPVALDEPEETIEGQVVAAIDGARIPDEDKEVEMEQTPHENIRDLRTAV